MLILVYRHFSNTEMNPALYKFTIESSIVAYITHWFWLSIPNRYIVYEYKLPLWLAFPICAVFIVTGVYLTLRVIKCIPCLAGALGIKIEKPKKTNPKYFD